MISQEFIDAKKVMEFYLDKIRKDGQINSKHAEQYANLHVLKFRIETMLNTLHSYDLKVTYE